MEKVHKAEVAVVVNTRIVVLCALVFFANLYSGALPDDELQVNANFYGDNGITIIGYPSISVSKKIMSSTSLNAKYLIDGISSATMKSRFDIDGISSATTMSSGGGDDVPDEVRHEFVTGVTQLIADATFSVNSIYSIEHDYESTSLILSSSIPFNQENTVLTAGYTGSWDESFPQIREWTKKKRVNSYSLGLSQILSKTMVGQIDASISENYGFQSDPYQVVQIISNDNIQFLENTHPNERWRYAIGAKTIFMVENDASLQLGYRYYYDTWEVHSHTLSLLYQFRTDNESWLHGFGLRSYYQTNAYFYKEFYDGQEEFRTVDSKLKELYSNELQYKATYYPDVENKSFSYNGHFNIYQRKTATRDWITRNKDLYAVIFGVGLRWGF